MMAKEENQAEVESVEEVEEEVLLLEETSLLPEEAVQEVEGAPEAEDQQEILRWVQEAQLLCLKDLDSIWTIRRTRIDLLLYPMKTQTEALSRIRAEMEVDLTMERRIKINSEAGKQVPRQPRRLLCRLSWNQSITTLD